MVDAAQLPALAAKAPPIDCSKAVDTSDIPETDFTGPQAVRGKYHARIVRASGLVQLDSDVRNAFPDDESVNRTLRRVIELADSLRGEP